MSYLCLVYVLCMSCVCLVYVFCMSCVCLLYVLCMSCARSNKNQSLNIFKQNNFFIFSGLNRKWKVENKPRKLLGGCPWLEGVRGHGEALPGQALHRPSHPGGTVRRFLWKIKKNLMDCGNKTGVLLCNLQPVFFCVNVPWKTVGSYARALWDVFSFREDYKNTVKARKTCIHFDFDFRGWLYV